jgi:probable rRNA maturation factor
MIDLENRTDFQIPENELFEILERFSNKTVDLVVCGKDEIQAINRDFRGKDEVTDVISFPVQEEVGNEPLGSIVICGDVAQEVSQVLEHSISEEFQILFLHGVLHLLGHDHETDNGEMRELEMEIREQFNLPESLIERI